MMCGVRCVQLILFYVYILHRIYRSVYRISMKVNRFSIGLRNPWRKHLAITIIFMYIILQTSLLYTARVNWMLLLFAEIPYLHEIFII